MWTVEDVEYKYTSRGGGTVADGRGVVGGCWEKREGVHLCTLGAGQQPCDFPDVDCFIFLYLPPPYLLGPQTLAPAFLKRLFAFVAVHCHSRHHVTDPHIYIPHNTSSQHI